MHEWRSGEENERNSILSLSCNQLIQAVREPEQSKYAADLLWPRSRLMFPHHVPEGCVTELPHTQVEFTPSTVVTNGWVGIEM